MNEFDGPDAPPPSYQSPPSWAPPPPQPPPSAPSYAPQPPATDAAALVRDMSAPLYRARDWMRLMGVLMIIAGALYALTLVGIIIAWLPIWMGVLLFKSAENIERARRRGDPADLVEGQDKLRTYFTLQGVLCIASVVLSGIAIVVMTIMGVGLSSLLKDLD